MTNAFHRACYNGHLEIAQLLYEEYGADINLPILKVQVGVNNGEPTEFGRLIHIVEEYRGPKDEVTKWLYTLSDLIIIENDETI